MDEYIIHIALKSGISLTAAKTELQNVETAINTSELETCQVISLRAVPASKNDYVAIVMASNAQVAASAAALFALDGQATTSYSLLMSTSAYGDLVASPLGLKKN
jgi:hypothetical protein